MYKLLIIYLLTITLASARSENENDRYMNKAMERMDKLLKQGSFENGWIYTKNDTISTRILTYKRSKRTLYHLICISKDTNDSIKIFKAEDINGYSINNTYYFSHSSEKCHFFIKRTQSGKVDLYERAAIPEDNRMLYYLKFENNDNLMVLAPYAENFDIWEYPSNSSTRHHHTGEQRAVILKSNKYEKKFKYFVRQYFGDCSDVVNLVKADVYTIVDVPSIVRIYNQCENK